MIILPFPPASLSGHAKGHWRSKSGPTAKYREAARIATLAARYSVPESGDINVHVTFYPPDRRGDRVNFPNRCKPVFDGIADALGVNDSRFVPHFYFCEPEKPGRVEVRIAAPCACSGDVLKGTGRNGVSAPPGPDQHDEVASHG